MTAQEIYDVYLKWTDNSPDFSLDDIFKFAIDNIDIYEDRVKVINHLFYLVPKPCGKELRYFAFFEENEFAKDARGDLHLSKSTLHTY